MKCPGDTSSARGFSAEKQAQQGESAKKQVKDLLFLLAFSFGLLKTVLFYDIML